MEAGDSWVGMGFDSLFLLGPPAPFVRSVANPTLDSPAVSVTPSSPSARCQATLERTRRAADHLRSPRTGPVQRELGKVKHARHLKVNLKSGDPPQLRLKLD